MKLYNWQQPDWPNFTYDLSGADKSLYAIAEKMGLINGKISHFSDILQTETMINLMIEEAVKTSKIEGENINRPDVRSSIKNKLGLNKTKEPVHDKRAKGIADLLIDVRDSFKNPLSQATLFKWHKMLMANHDKSKLKIGDWRTDKEAMQIVSGHHGKLTVHFEAPPAKNVPKEMKKYIEWFNETAPDGKHPINYPPVRAAIAHLYFESIHPFDDGNGRIGRALAEKALSQGFGYPVMLSLSNAIEADKKSYYAALNKASKSNEITDWMSYFASVVLNAQDQVEIQINFILKKSMFFDKFKNELNERQLKVINRMLKAGPDGFEGGMTAKKYMAITGTSKATATRDLQQLHNINAFVQTGGGRSIKYQINL